MIRVPVSARKRAMMVGLAAAVAMVATTPLAGAHGGDTNKIHACVVSGSGSLRIIGAGQSCKNGEVALDWSLDSDAALSTFKDELKNAAGDATVNEGSDPVSWFKVKDVPAGFADGTDAIDGGNAADLTCTNAAGCVSSVELSGTIDASKLAGGITGSLIADGTIAALNLATDSITADKIATQTIDSDHLKDGAVKPRKLTANASNGFGGTSISTAGSLPAGGSAATALVDIDDTADHLVLMTGQAVVACTCSVAGDSVTFRYQLVADGTPVGPAYPGVAGYNDPTVINLSNLTLSPPSPSPHSYSIVVTVTSATPGASMLNISDAQLTAVDLGRKL